MTTENNGWLKKSIANAAVQSQGKQLKEQFTQKRDIFTLYDLLISGGVFKSRKHFCKNYSKTTFQLSLEQLKKQYFPQKILKTTDIHRT